jgi:hypothetical protein
MILWPKLWSLNDITLLTNLHVWAELNRNFSSEPHTHWFDWQSLGLEASEGCLLVCLVVDAACSWSWLELHWLLDFLTAVQWASQWMRIPRKLGKFASSLMTHFRSHSISSAVVICKEWESRAYLLFSLNLRIVYSGIFQRSSLTSSNWDNIKWNWK